MKVAENKIIIMKDDFALLNACVKNTKIVAMKEPHNARSLSEELRRAVVVDKGKFPEDVIRLNSTVTIKDLDNGNEIVLKIVLPEFADFKQKKISVLAPMGTALIGFKKGQTIAWKMPAGMKNFLILEVQD